MISLLHGIVNSRRDPQSPFDLFIDRQLTPIFGPFGGSEPVTPGTGYNYPIPTDNPGYLHFEMSVTGDTSSVYEYGIVSATFPNPTYSNNAQLVNYPQYFDNPSYGVTYSVSAPELRYYRMYASDISGNYFYSDGPGLLFQMEKIEFSDIILTGGGFYGPYDVTIVARLVDPVGTVSEAGFYINQGGVGIEPELYDPYWWGATGAYLTTGTQSIVSNQFSYFIDNIGGADDINLYVRAFAVYSGVRYWSQLNMILV